MSRKINSEQPNGDSAAVGAAAEEVRGRNLFGLVTGDISAQMLRDGNVAQVPGLAQSIRFSAN